MLVSIINADSAYLAGPRKSSGQPRLACPMPPDAGNGRITAVRKAISGHRPSSQATNSAAKEMPMKKRCRWTLLVCTLVLGLTANWPFEHGRAAEIRVVVSPQAAPVERSAAAELAGYLRQIYPQDRFTPGEQLPSSGLAILLGNMQRDWHLKELVVARPTEPESYVVTTASERPTGHYRRRRFPRGGLRRLRAAWRSSVAGSISPTMRLPRHATIRSPSTAGNWPTGRWFATGSCSTGTISSAAAPPGTCPNGRRGSFSRRSRATTPSWSMPTATTPW